MYKVQRLSKIYFKSKQKLYRNQATVTKTHYLCNWIEATLTDTYVKRRSGMLILQVGHVGNFRLGTRDGIVVLTL